MNDMIQTQLDVLASMLRTRDKLSERIAEQRAGLRRLRLEDERELIPELRTCQYHPEKCEGCLDLETRTVVTHIPERQ